MRHLLQLLRPDLRQVQRFACGRQTAGRQEGVSPLHDRHVLHAEVSEEAGLLAQLARDLFVNLLHLVEHLGLLEHVREVRVDQADVVCWLEGPELLANVLLVLLVHEGLHTVLLGGEADAQQPLEEMAH